MASGMRQNPYDASPSPSAVNLLTPGASSGRGADPRLRSVASDASLVSRSSVATHGPSVLRPDDRVTRGMHPEGLRRCPPHCPTRYVPRRFTRGRLVTAARPVLPLAGPHVLGRPLVRRPA